MSNTLLDIEYSSEQYIKRPWLLRIYIVIGVGAGKEWRNKLIWDHEKLPKNKPMLWNKS